MVWRSYVKLVTVVTNENLQSRKKEVWAAWNMLQPGIKISTLHDIRVCNDIGTVLRLLSYYRELQSSIIELNFSIKLQSPCKLTLSPCAKIVPRRVNITHTPPVGKGTLPQILDIDVSWIGSRYYKVLSLNSRLPSSLVCNLFRPGLSGIIKVF